MEHPVVELLAQGPDILRHELKEKRKRKRVKKLAFLQIAAAAFDDACRAMMDAADAFEREGVDGIKRVHAEMVARSAARKSGSPEPAGEAQ